MVQNNWTSPIAIPGRASERHPAYMFHLWQAARLAIKRHVQSPHSRLPRRRRRQYHRRGPIRAATVQRGLRIPSTRVCRRCMRATPIPGRRATLATNLDRRRWMPRQPGTVISSSTRRLSRRAYGRIVDLSAAGRRWSAGQARSARDFVGRDTLPPRSAGARDRTRHIRASPGRSPAALPGERTAAVIAPPFLSPAPRSISLNARAAAAPGYGSRACGSRHPSAPRTTANGRIRP